MHIGRLWAHAMLFVVGVLCLVVAGCGVAEQDETAAEGRIAFARGDRSDIFAARDVYVIDASGDNERKLDGVSEDFSWSPDGARLAYSSRVGIAVVNSGTEAREWQTAAPCRSPDWSPRGDLIACDSFEPYRIVTINTRTRASKTLTPDCCYMPAWSPDGRQIAYWSFGSNYLTGEEHGPSGLFVMNADGSAKHRLTPRGSVGTYVNSPAWSPNGHTIAFPAGNDIWTIDTRGGKPRRLFDGAGGTTNNLTWRPKGRQLAFTHGDGHDFELFLINADGTGLRQLTDNDQTDRQQSWSPDGTALTFATNRDGNFEIYIMNADGSNATRLTNTKDPEADPAWSPTK